MVSVVCDNADTEKNIRKLIDLSKEGGAWFNPDLIIRSENGDLCIEAEKPIENAEFIKLTQDVLLPVDKIEITVKKGRFEYEEKQEGAFTSLQHRLMETKFELYNSAQKVESMQEQSFWLQQARHPEIQNGLLKARLVHNEYRKWAKFAQTTKDPEKIAQFSGDMFIKSRVLGHKDYRVRETTRVIMPIVDFMNHHWAGSPFSSAKRPGDPALSVHVRRPAEGTKQCFAFYGNMDALDAFIKYGFADNLSPVVRSVPVTLEIEGIGFLQIQGNMPAITSQTLGQKIQDLRRFMPQLSQGQRKDLLIATHLFIPNERSRFALRRVLAILITKLAGEPLEQSKAWDLLLKAESDVLEKNDEFYTALKEKITQRQGEVGTDSALEAARGLVDSQLEKIMQYRALAESMNQEVSENAKAS